MDSIRTGLITGALSLLALSGCAHAQAPPIVGVVALDATRVGHRAPGGTFMDAAGKVRSLPSIYGDATMVSFAIGNCRAAVSPRLREAAVGSHWDIMFIEVCSHPDGCASHGDCVLTGGGRSNRTVTLCDAHGLLARWWGVTTREAVFVLDEWGTIAAVGGQSDIEELLLVAGNVARDAELERRSVEWGD